MVTYNTIVRDIKTFFEMHRQVHQFLHITTWDEEAKENLYVTALLVPQQSNINNTQINLNFNLFVVDILNSDRSNQRDVFDDTLGIIQDFVAYFSGNECIEWELAPDATIQPVTERPFDDVLSGWVLNFVVNLPFRKSVCDLPLDNIE